MNFWSRLRTRVARFFGRAPPAPGRFETGAKFAWRGWLAALPWVWPRREYLLYVPQGWSRWRRAPLLVFCHGCRQSPEQFAEGTRVAATADRLGWLVLLPRQKESANHWQCWNWFDSADASGHGEAAIVAAMIRSVRREYRADPRRVVAVGISAGGALAASLGVHHSDIVRATAVHSGLACGAATSAFSALGVMLHGPETDVVAIAARAREGAGKSLRVPLLAIHGANDSIVSPGNAIALVRQYLRLNGHAAADAPDATPATTPPPADSESSRIENGRTITIREWRLGARLVARHVVVAGLGHAWSGGDDALPYNDSDGPDATSMIGAFVADALP